MKKEKAIEILSRLERRWQYDDSESQTMAFAVDEEFMQAIYAATSILKKVPPIECSVGDTVWYLNAYHNRVLPTEIKEIRIVKDEVLYVNLRGSFKNSDIHDWIYLSKKEADEALASITKEEQDAIWKAIETAKPHQQNYNEEAERE